MVSDKYDCAYYGKWHLGDELVAQHGFDDWISIEDGIYRPYYSEPEQLELRSSYHHFLVKSGFPTDKVLKDGAALYSRPYAAAMGENFTKAAFLGKEASRFLRERKDNDRPFLLSVNMLEPHPPFHGPLNDRYEPEAMPVGEAYLVPPGEDAPKKKRMCFERIQREKQRLPLDTEWDWRRVRANYYGLVTQVDRTLGCILDALEESGLADNTVVVFTSDHGEMLGDHALLGKGSFYEESARIPLMIRVPWLSREQTMLETPVSQIDLVPTLLDLLGQPIQDHLQGVSRLGVLKGEEDMSDNHIIIEWNAPDKMGIEGRTVVTADGYKLSLYQDDISELYDLNTDPCELENVYRNPEHQGRIKEMSELIFAWQKETEDKMVLSN
jgi:choline-sulfatase